VKPLRPIDQAIKHWTRILGSGHIVIDQVKLQEAATATFATSHTIPVILRPSSRQQVQQCVRIAQVEGVPVYPVSGGKNWGYGSRVPSSDGCALLDLSRLNRILDFDEKLGYVTLEPGVTQKQLYAFLTERKSSLWMDPTGASPECSLIGNTMERGFGHTPYGDHFNHVCGLEVVLPTGECLDTGFARFAKAKTAPLYRWGVGPNVDGIFSQSNLGIVTRMTLWLMPAPEYFQAFFFRCDSKDSLAQVVDALRPLRMDGTIRSSVHIGNDYKLLPGLRQYPWTETDGKTPLPPSLMENFRKDLRIGCWSGSGGLYGSRGQVKEDRKLIRKALAGKVGKLQFMDDRLLHVASRFAGLYSVITGWDLRAALELLKPNYGLMKGIPTSQPLRSAYWRKRKPAPVEMDPDRDGCGLLWCSPILPMEGAQIEALTAAVTETMLDHGFEPQISLTLVTERAVACVVCICYDRHVAGEDERAAACHRSLLKLFAAGGYPCYRLGIQSMSEMDGQSGYHNLIRSLKKTLDPGDVLSPGRYQVPISSGVSLPSKEVPGFDSEKPGNRAQTKVTRRTISGR
jgi:4-cresol dehydrogenase (hydroxylating)